MVILHRCASHPYRARFSEDSDHISPRAFPSSRYPRQLQLGHLYLVFDWMNSVLGVRRRRRRRHGGFELCAEGSQLDRLAYSEPLIDLLAFGFGILRSDTSRVLQQLKCSSTIRILGVNPCTLRSVGRLIEVRRRDTLTGGREGGFFRIKDIAF